MQCGTYLATGHPKHNLETRIFVRQGDGRKRVASDTLRSLVIKNSGEKGIADLCLGGISEEYYTVDMWRKAPNCVMIRADNSDVILAFVLFSIDPTSVKGKSACMVHLVCAGKGTGYGTHILDALQSFCCSQGIMKTKLHAVTAAVSYYITKLNYIFPRVNGQTQKDRSIIKDYDDKIRTAAHKLTELKLKHRKDSVGRMNAEKSTNLKLAGIISSLSRYGYSGAEDYKRCNALFKKSESKDMEFVLLRSLVGNNSHIVNSTRQDLRACVGDGFRMQKDNMSGGTCDGVAFQYLGSRYFVAHRRILRKHAFGMEIIS